MIKTAQDLHPEAIELKSEAVNSGLQIEIAVDGAGEFSVFRPTEDVVASADDVVVPLENGKVAQLVRLNEEGPCGGVNMAELALDRLIEYNRNLPAEDRFTIHANHPPSKGAERHRLYEEAGVIFGAPIDEVPEGSPYLFSAHGADPRKVKQAHDRGLKVIDTTCPLVDRVYRHMRNDRRDNPDLEPDETAVLYLTPLYKRDHPEVAGTRGVAETAGFRFIPVRNTDEARAIFEGEVSIGPEGITAEGIKRLLVTGLTTNSATEVLGMGEDVLQASDGSEIEVMPYDPRDVCRTVQYRQDGIRQIIDEDETELLAIIGAVGSNNTNEQVRVALSHLVERARVVGDVSLRSIVFGNHFSQLPDDIRGNVGLATGASTGKGNIEQVVTYLNPTTIRTVGQSDRKMFTALPSSNARRVLARVPDFSWLHS